MIININRTVEENTPHEATRYSWKVSPTIAKKAEYILAICHGLIVAAFTPHEWLPTTTENFPGREPVPGRYGFVGEEAPEDIWRLYVGKRIPDEYRTPGAANPIKYSYK